MTTNTGGPAFPGPYANENGIVEVLWKQQGMTLRDYFAAKAMQEWVGAMNPAKGAALAYEWADAMLKARDQ